MPDLDAIAQLVFFVLIVIGWVVKAIVEAKQAKQRRSAPTPEPIDETVEAPQDRVVRPRPHPTPPPRAPRRGRLADRARLRHLDVSVGGHDLDSTTGHAPGRLLHSSAAAIAQGVTSRREQRTSVLKRLSGGADVAPGRDLTRAGVIWSEILGPCRAQKGPHRSPAATRRRPC